MNHFTYMNKRAQSLVLALLLVFSCFSQFNRHLGKNPTHDHSFFCVLASLLGLEWTADHRHDHHAEEEHALGLGQDSFQSLPLGLDGQDWALAGLYILVSWTILIGLASSVQAQSPIIQLGISFPLSPILFSTRLRAVLPRAPPVAFL